MIKKTIPLAIVACLLLTTGCSDVQERASETVATQEKEIGTKINQLRDSLRGADMSAVKFSDKVWLGSRGYRQQNGEPLPNKYDHMTYMTAEPQSLREIVAELSEITNLKFIISEKDPSSMSAGASTDKSMDLAGSTSFADNRIALRYSGDFVGLLNQISTKFDISWEHRDNVIYLSKYVTKTLALYALPSSVELETDISSESDSSVSAGRDAGSGGGESSSKSGTENKIKLESSLNVWKEIEAVVSSMLPEGSTYAMAPSTGTLTVTTTPMAVEKVENLIKQQNEIMSRQVVIDVSVMTIVTKEGEMFKNKFESALQNASEKFGFSWSGPTGNLTETTGLGSFSPSFTSASGENTASLLLNALSEKFDRTIVTNSTVTTLNSQSVPLQIITRESYLKSLTTTVNDTTASTAAEPGDITTGFVMNVLPRILANGEIMMQYSMSLSEKLKLETINFGEDGKDLIQLPTVVSRDFLQNIKLKSGNTLILTGYDRVANSSEKAGTASPNNMLFGGGRNGQINKEVLVIFVTPRIL